MRIAVLGTGNVGGTLGRRWAALGHQVVFGARDPGSPKARAAVAGADVSIAPLAEATQDAEVVVLAVPWGAVPEALAAAGDLAGKVLIDCTNAVGEGFRPAVAGGGSAAELVASLAPGARVVKGFNTVGAGIMADPTVSGGRAAMPFCGDDRAANALVRELGEQLGFEMVEAGPLAAAPLLESLALLWIRLAYRQGLGPNVVFGLLRRAAS